MSEDMPWPQDVLLEIWARSKWNNMPVCKAFEKMFEGLVETMEWVNETFPNTVSFDEAHAVLTKGMQDWVRITHLEKTGG